MTAVGFDFGNDNSVVAIPRKRQLDALNNDNDRPETPSIVFFGEKERYIGVRGAIQSSFRESNPKNTISQIKRLIGRLYSDPELQQDLKSLPFTVTEGPDKYPLIHAQYLGKMRTFTPTQVLGMVFSDLKSIADKHTKLEVVEGTIDLKSYFGDLFCIGIPAYFTELQRRSVLNAAEIAGLLPSLIHDTTAIALYYGITKTNLPENDQMNVAFVDIGHASLQVCIAGFMKGQLKILAYSYDRCLGGRNFDEALFDHFAEKFKEEYSVDVYLNAKDSSRLRVACEVLKKALTNSPEAYVDIDCVIDKKDVKGCINRKEFEKICATILDRVKKPLEKALTEANLKVENIHSVEVVGSGSHVPAIIEILAKFFGKKPRRMNASESVAKGCALQCAILHPSYKVDAFKVHENFPFNIAFGKGSAPDTQNKDGVENQNRTILISKGNQIPDIKELTFKELTFNELKTFSIDFQYADVELQTPTKISTYTIGRIRKTKSPHTSLKVKVYLSRHGIVSVDSATLLEEAEVKVPVVTPANQMDIGESSSYAANSNAKAGALRGKVKKWKIPVSEFIYDGMSPEDLEEAKEEERKLAQQDRLMIETRDEMNSLLDYIYKMINKLDNEYRELETEFEIDELAAKFREVECWCSNEGNDEAKNVYVAKLEELKKLGGPIKERYRTQKKKDLKSEN